MSAHLDQIREFLSAGKFAENHTHMLELFTLMRDGLGDLALLESANYDVDGLKARLKFADRKTYEITIKEVRE